MGSLFLFCVCSIKALSKHDELRNKGQIFRSKVLFPMKVLTVANRKGGVGKTTTVVQLALCFAKLKKRVLVIDLDPQGNATQLLITRTFIPEDATIGEVLTGRRQLSEVLLKSDLGLDIDVAPASDVIKTVEREIDRYPLRDFILRNALDSVDYDVVLIDTSPAADSNLVRNGLVASTHTLIPIEASLLSISGYVLALEDLDSLFRHLPKTDCPTLLGPFLTRYDSRESVSREAFEYLKEHVDERFTEARIFNSVIRTNTRLKSTVDIKDLKKSQKGYADHLSLATEILERIGGPEAEVKAPAKKPAAKKAPAKKSRAKKAPVKTEEQAVAEKKPARKTTRKSTASKKTTSTKRVTAARKTAKTRKSRTTRKSGTSRKKSKPSETCKAE